ncbi:MAG TPA: phospholipase D-like domain-containing protein [Chloroflexota bacterium]|nr:phospholipase D-like domain-containing protein [Chloroflexota bacterium]
MHGISLAPGVRFLAVLFLLLTACKTVSDPIPIPDPAPIGAPSVQLSVEPDDGVQPLVRFIDASQHTLDVAMYLLSDRDVIGALERSRQRGVEVRVMLEEHPYGNGPGNRQIYDRLKKAGVSVTWSPPTFQLSHDKYAIADRQIALVGTANWTLSAFKYNREYFVVDRDPTDVMQIEAVFQGDWQRHPVALDDPHLVVSPTNSRTDLLGLIASARHELDLEAEELQDSGIETALGQAARRGVQVRVIVPRPGAGVNDPNAFGERTLDGDGVQVRKLRTPFIHAKVVIVDEREAFVGSENISKPSLDGNREVGLLISDPDALKRLNATFARDWTSARP